MKEVSTEKLQRPFVYVEYAKNSGTESRRPLSVNMSKLISEMKLGKKYECENMAEFSAFRGLLARGLVYYVEMMIEDNGEKRRITSEDYVLRKIFGETPIPASAPSYWIIADG